MLQSLAYCGIQNGELERAAGLAREAIQLGFALEDVDVVHTVALLCEVAGEATTAVLAGLLWSAVERLEQDLEDRWEWQWEKERARVEAVLGQPDRAFEFGVACGYAMSVEEVLSRCLPLARGSTAN